MNLKTQKQYRLVPSNPQPQMTNAQRSSNRRLARQRRRNIQGLGGKQFNLHEITKSHARSYAEAVINPFDEAALGAIYPDGARASIAANDLIRTQLDFSKIAEKMAANNTPMQGVVCAFLPRCNASGWMSGSTSSTNVTTLAPASFASNSSQTDIGAVTNPSPCKAYVLAVAFLSGSKLYALDQFDDSIQEGLNMLEYDRYDLIQQSCEATRIIGAGIKIWPTAPQLTTGGRAYGGSMANEDFYKIANGTSLVYDGGNIESALTGARVESGPSGVTVRYSSTQSPKQTLLQDILIDIDNEPATEGGGERYVAVTGQEVSSQDLCQTGDHIPVVIWRYENSSSIYNLSLFSTVHLQSRINALNPYRTSQVTNDVSVEYLRTILNHPRFPVAVSGHSFKSFFAHASKILGTAAAAAPHLMKIFKLLESF